VPKDNINLGKSNSDWKKTRANHLSDMGLLSKVYTELLHFNNKINNPIHKGGRGVFRHFPKEDTQMASKLCKEPQHHQSLGNANESHNESLGWHYFFLIRK
jgi:hypothetical protein